MNAQELFNQKYAGAGIEAPAPVTGCKAQGEAAEMICGDCDE